MSIGMTAAAPKEGVEGRDRASTMHTKSCSSWSEVTCGSSMSQATIHSANLCMDGTSRYHYYRARESMTAVWKGGTLAHLPYLKNRFGLEFRSSGVCMEPHCPLATKPVWVVQDLSHLGRLSACLHH